MRSIFQRHRPTRMRLGSLFSKRNSGRRSSPRMIKPLRMEPLESRVVLDARPLISELVASNVDGLRDDDNDRSDWLELTNAGDVAANLDGWYLTDDANDLDKWRFPQVTLDPGQFMVVFASGKDRTDPATPLHTNFRLDVGGEYLALVEPDGTTVASQFSPAYPALTDDVAFGITQSNVDTIAIAEGARQRYLFPPSKTAAINWGPLGPKLVSTIPVGSTGPPASASSASRSAMETCSASTRWTKCLKAPTRPSSVFHSPSRHHIWPTRCYCG